MDNKIIFSLFIFLLLSCSKHNNIIHLSGMVEVREVDISSRVTSRVIDIFVQESDFVKKGQILAKIDDRILSAQKDSAQAFFDFAKINYERCVNLYETKSISKEQLDNAKTQFIQADAGLKQAKIMLDEATIYAPWDGVILKKYIEVGEIVSSNTPLFTIGDLSIAKVIVYVSLIDLGKIKLKDKARVYTDSLPNKWLDGTITFISNKAEFTPKNIQTKDERVKQVFAVEITVPNPEYILKPGMPVDVEL